MCTLPPATHPPFGESTCRYLVCWLNSQGQGIGPPWAACAFQSQGQMLVLIISLCHFVNHLPVSGTVPVLCYAMQCCSDTMQSPP